MKTTKNVISNFFGQLYVASLGFIFLPFYLKSLGPEAFSLIGIYSLLQALLHLLDGGLTATLGRESAKYLGGGHTHLSFRLLIKVLKNWIRIQIRYSKANSIFNSFFSKNKNKWKWSIIKDEWNDSMRGVGLMQNLM